MNNSIVLPIVKHSLAYNPHIDALRGIAVVLVVLFHIWPSYFSFGYVGVDIFFVISGFLITQIIFTGLENNKFSLKKFYRNRIRRIFPSLIAVLVVLLVLGYIFFSPTELAQVGKHIQASSFFYENFQLIREIGYWDEVAQLKPLLHCWSLAIEEQFYIFWPLLLVIIYKLKLNNIITFSILCFFLFALPRHFEINEFYNIISRSWQLAFGGYAFILSYYFKWIPAALKKIYLYIYILFFISILISYNNQQYSTAKTLIVVLGTMAIIVLLSNINFKSAIFSNDILIFVGLISYPLYLIHYVIISFFHIVGIDVSKNGIFIIIASIIISFLLYRCIEVYARRKEEYGFSAFLFILIICIGLCGHSISKRNGIPERKHFASLNTYLERQFTSTPRRNEFGIQLVSNVLGYMPKNECIISTSDDITKKFILLIGDSHAYTSYPGFAQEFKRYGYETILLANAACPPYKGGAMGKNIGELNFCQERIGSIYSMVNSNIKIEKIIFATRMFYMYDSGPGPGEDRLNFHYKNYFEQKTPHYDKKQLFFNVLEDTFKFFESKTDIDFFYIMENPTLDFFPKSCIVRPFGLGRKCAIRTDSYLEWTNEYRHFIDILKNKYKNITILDPIGLFCDDDYCYAMRNGKMLYLDDDHYSVDGSIEQAKYFIHDIFR